MENNLAKRRALYLERAEEADRMARMASEITMQDAFRTIADSWRGLADQVAPAIKRH